MARRELGFLLVLSSLHLLPDRHEQLLVALSRILCECGDERVGHGAGGLAGFLRVGGLGRKSARGEENEQVISQ